MRLINTSTLHLEEFEGSDIPGYAILSHRWQKEEVLFKDIETGTASSKRGYQKVLKLCELAKEDGLQYAWIDTCCIDKSSSAELSEAINSMYKWYQDSRICYAHLFDVTTKHQFAVNESYWVKQETNEPNQYVLEPFNEIFLEEFYKSVWFRRGWTLQELIAPTAMMFFNSTWEELGSKKALSAAISFATSIPTGLLCHKTPLQNFTIAERMSWAAERVTTRIEDIAYSLLGVFDVNMPLLYGEGNKAFRRLQEEIIKVSEDDSILLFEADAMGALASSPCEFSCHRQSFNDEVELLVKPFQDISRTRTLEFVSDSPETLLMNNSGLAFSFLLFPWCSDLYLGQLRTGRTEPGYWTRAYIFLHFNRETGRLNRCHFQGEAIKWLHSWAAFEVNFPESIKLDKFQVISKFPLTGGTCIHEWPLPHPPLITNPTIPRLALVVRYSGQDIEFKFQYWIARRLYQVDRLCVAVASGAREVQAILCPSRRNMSSCVYLAFDHYGTPCLVRKTWHLEDCSLSRTWRRWQNDICSQASHRVLAYEHFLQSVSQAATGSSSPELTVIKSTPSPGFITSSYHQTGIPGLSVTITPGNRVCMYEFKDNQYSTMLDSTPNALLRNSSNAEHGMGTSPI